jgi:hypothetical protein
LMIREGSTRPTLPAVGPHGGQNVGHVDNRPACGAAGLAQL